MTDTEQDGTQKLPAISGMTLTELVRIIANSSTDHRQKAMEMLMLVGLKVCMPLLIEGVRNDDDADLRNGSMDALVAFGAMAVPHLVELLTDQNEEVRNFSTVMLGDIGNPEAVLPLIDALLDPEDNVRHGAAEALGKIGDQRALLPLQELAKGDFWDQFYANAALEMLSGNAQTAIAGSPAETAG